MLTTDEDIRAAEREQWDDGNNYLAVSPGVVLGYDRNVATTPCCASTASKRSPCPHPRLWPTRCRPSGRAAPPGSMAPKVEAACRFVEATGGMAAIGRLDDPEALLGGKAGTIITGDLPRG